MSLSLAIRSRASSALVRARRVISERGISPFLGVSSIDGGRSASGSMPACASRVRRRGEALASTSLGLRPARRPVGLVRASSWRSVSRRGLSVRLKALNRAAFVEVMRLGLRDSAEIRPEDAHAVRRKSSRWWPLPVRSPGQSPRAPSCLSRRPSVGSAGAVTASSGRRRWPSAPRR